MQLSRVRFRRPATLFALALSAAMAAGSDAVLAQSAGDASGGGGVVIGRLPASTRTLALGGAPALGNPDPDGLFRNPALAQGARGMGFHLHDYTGTSKLVAMAGGAAWLGGGVGLGLRSAEYRIPTVGTGLPEARPGDRMASSLRNGEPGTAVSETALTAAYGRTLKGFRVGAAASWLRVRAGSESDVTGFVDLGVARAVGPVTVGLSGGGLAPSLDLAPGLRRVPKWLTAGAGSRTRQVGPLDLAGALSLTVVEGGKLEAGGGLEVAWWPIQGRTFVGRVGLGGSEIRDASLPTLGAAFLGDSFTLEYAWRDVGGSRGLHAVGLRFR